MRNTNAFDDDGAPWPDEVMDAIHSREESTIANQPPPAAGSPGEDDEPPAQGKAAALPGINSLVERIPAETREVLEELFRAKFVAVRRIPKKFIQG